MHREFGHLSEPLTYDGDTLMDRIDNGMTHFREIFLNKDVKPKLYGKRIFFDMNRVYRRQFTLPLPERYLHLVSLGDDEKFTVFPCNNDYSCYSICETLCEELSKYYCFQILDRWECPCRLARIHWIPEIIRLANEGNDLIKYWAKEDRDLTTNRKFYKYYLRYTFGFTDYVIVLRSDDGNEYVFVSAYPVSSRKAKSQFDKEYKKYLQKTEEPEV